MIEETHWHPVVQSADVAGQPLAVTLLEHALVVWRDAAGQVQGEKWDGGLLEWAILPKPFAIPRAPCRRSRRFRSRRVPAVSPPPDGRAER